MKRIYKKSEEIKEVRVGDIIEISDNLFIKITALKRDFVESIAGKIKNQKDYEGVVVDIDGKQGTKRHSSF